MEIELDVLWHTDETRQLADAGIDYDVNDLEFREVTFYRIDAISPNFWDDEHEFCNIHSGGEKWICNLPYLKVKKLIKLAQQE